MNNVTDIRITPFTKDYGCGVIDLIVPIQQAEFGLPITAKDQPDLADIPDVYQKGRGNFWVACHDAQVVGSIALLDIGNRQAALRKMFVRSDFRGEAAGTAGRLLETLLAWANKQDLRTIFLGTTPKFLAAHRFYEKNGFTEILKQDLPEAFPVMTVDTKFYRYDLG